MNKVQLKFYTQYLPVTNTINIYQDITENNRDNNKYMELQCVLSKQNVYDDMTDKEFIKDIVSHFKKGLRD